MGFRPEETEVQTQDWPLYCLERMLSWSGWECWLGSGLCSNLSSGFSIARPWAFIHSF